MTTRAAPRDDPNPVLRRQQRVDFDAFPPAYHRELAAIRAYCEQMDFTRATEKGFVSDYRRCLPWVLTQAARTSRRRAVAAEEFLTPMGRHARRYAPILGDQLSTGLGKVLWQPDAAEDCARWFFRKRADGLPGPKSHWASFENSIRTFWLVMGKKPRAVDDRMSTFRRAFRSNGKDHGPMDLIRLRPPDPPPAPSDAQLARGAASIARQIEEARARGDEGLDDRIYAVCKRNAMLLLRQTAMRLSSGASLRYDQLGINPEDNSLYFANVVVKPSRQREWNPFHEVVINRRGYADWTIDPELLIPLAEEARLRGIDLFGWLETRDPKCLQWTRVTSADPYGEIAIGKLVCPVWPGGRDGYLTRGGFQTFVKVVVRDDLGMTRGVAHPFRRRAVIDTVPIAARYPQALEKIHHMTPGTRERYFVTAEQDSRYCFADSRTVAQILAGEPPMTPAPTPLVRPGRPAATISPASLAPRFRVTSPSAPPRQRKLRDLSLIDLWPRDGR